MTVRRRFALTVAATIAVTVALFATLSIVVLDSTLRSASVARLRTAANAIATTVDVHGNRPSVDAGDLRQISAMHAETPFSIVTLDGSVLGGSPVPRSANDVALVSVPVVRNGRTYGHVVVWQSIAWIGDFDRAAAILSAVAGVLLITVGVAIATRVAKSFEEMLAQLEAAYARERQFVADASHELRTPLAVVRAETELALRRPRSDEEYRRALESISHECGRLESLVDGLLAAARAELDAFERERLDANSMVRHLSDRLKPAAALRGVEIELATDGEAFFYGNGAMVERALLAVAHNAIGFARGVVRLGVSREGDDVRIDVADDGTGFSDEALTHATERFWRGDPTRNRSGTGLGLAIARSLLEANGGRIALANAGGAGGAVVSLHLKES
ncbi:MAG TPA: HAMP domain-containing sensor histidine kinase [Candidatus Baltobacteraceae bacterium]|nr:HAMP domain-containing sensor histidine kinase [Candidatus Baltobacteraceae bacterium]